MDIGFTPPSTGYNIFNPWAEFNISGQFLCETFVLLAPGMPQTAGKIGLNYTTVAISNEPAQATQLFTALISTAFLENDIQKILDAGEEAIDRNSKILQIVRDGRSWHSRYPDDWRETRRLLKEKYTQEGGATRDWNGYELNTGSVIGSLLCGNGNFVKTLQPAFNFGWDADNNVATTNYIMIIITGKIPGNYINN